VAARSGVFATIGRTPLVKLERLYPDFDQQVWAKLEFFNPGGSIKDRSAISMLTHAVETGAVVPGRSIVVESSSGNLAIGMAQFCSYHGIRFRCVVDVKTTAQNIAVLRAHGVELEVIDQPDPVSGEFLPARLKRVKEILASTPEAYWPNQYGNLLNPAAHRETFAEIATALNGEVDYLICAVGSFGTIRGCAEYIREHRMNTSIVAVDALGSAIFDGQQPRKRHLPGHGSAIRPALFDPSAAAEVVHVDDLECIVGCRRLAAREAILAGGSSGAVVAAFESIQPKLRPGATCVVILADSGTRYLDTIYSDAWVEQHFGERSATSWNYGTVGEAQC
jgi:N-(2-amino-2-carboxyethyl)-L-glutamate synthase